MAIISAFIILVSMFVIPASATNVNYSVTSASGQKGDTVTVTVKVSSSIGVTSAILNVNFDSSKLQYVSGSSGSMFTTCTVKAVSSSSVKCTGMTMGDSSAKKSGTFATLKFKILADSGTASLTISPSGSAGWRRTARSRRPGGTAPRGCRECSSGRADPARPRR